MAEVVVSLASKLVETAVSSVLHGICWRRRSSTEFVERLRVQIPLIRAILEDAERRQFNDSDVKAWLEKVKDEYYELINLLAELSIGEMKYHNVVQKIDDVMGRVEGYLTEAKEQFGLSERPPHPQSDMGEDLQGRLYSATDPAAIYGRYNESKTLIGKILRKDGQAHVGIRYISIVGSNGMGKTALAHHVCNTSQVVRNFNSISWIYVSKDFRLNETLRALCEHFEKGRRVDEHEINAQRVRGHIQRVKWLIVMDDLWSIDDTWDQLRDLFNCGVPGSTILITTRDPQVAKRAGSRPADDIVQLNSLSNKDFWSIVKDTAFDPSTHTLVREKVFAEICMKFKKEYHGNPAVAKSFGGMLRGKKNIEEWSAILDTIVEELEAMNKPDLKISLTLSYCYLPSVWRQCLLYCSIFRQNQYIDVDKLVRLWMAQGFIASDHDEMEREGWICFMELLVRSFFQEFKQDDNGNYRCKLNAGVSDFIKFLAANECHIMLLENKTQLEDNRVPEKARHCTLYVAAEASLPASIANIDKLHTLIILSEYSSTDPTTLTNLLKDMRWLRALDLSFCSLKKLPSKVGALLFLRYLDLSFNRDLKKLPKAICNLFNLQTLNLNGCDDLRKLPKGIGKLTRLRHLEILWTTNLSYLPKGVASLTSLRTLSRFFGASGVHSKSCDLRDLVKLDKLEGCISIEGLEGETNVSQAKTAGLKSKKHLRGLQLWFSVVESENKDQDLLLLKLLEAPPNLECLGIFYYGGLVFPDWMTALKKLKHLMLADCSECESLPPLGKLPSLETLEIKNMARVNKVGSQFLGLDNVEEGSLLTSAFPCLKTLSFRKLDNWEAWDGINGNANVMPSLSTLSIVGCAKLTALPNYINNRRGGSLKIEKN